METLIALMIAFAAFIIFLIVGIPKIVNKKIKRTQEQIEEQLQGMYVEPERMRLVHSHVGTAIYQDTQTGVQYLVIGVGQRSVSVTPMLDRDGKPFVG